MSNPTPPKSVACIYLKQHEAEITPKRVHALAEACFRFTPQIAIRENEAIFLDITQSLRLFSEASFKLKAQALLKRMGWQAFKISLGETAAHALAEAKYGAPFPLESLADFASPFVKNPELEKKIKAQTAILKQLGIQDFAHFAGIPRQTLVSRFGKDLLRLSERIHGQDPVAWPGFHPAPVISEKTWLPEGGENLDALIFTLKGLVDRAMARLRGRAERASIIQVEFELEKWSTLKIYQRKWQIDLPLPQGSASSLIPILREQIDYALQREPLESPVMSIQFEVLETIPGAGAQRDFFQKKEAEQEAWNALIGRLGQKLGIEHVFVAVPVERYLPEKAYRKSLRTQDVNRLSDAYPPRPARLLSQPEPIRVQGEVLIHPRSGKSWRSVAWQGPERLGGEWWNNEARFSRDYFKVATAQGEQLWVFQKETAPSEITQNAAGFFLHGFFD